jgi:hypothetical protein
VNRRGTTRWLNALDRELALRGLTGQVTVFLPSSRLCTVYIKSFERYADVLQRSKLAVAAADELRPDGMAVRYRRAVNGGVDVKVDSRYL